MINYYIHIIKDMEKDRGNKKLKAIKDSIDTIIKDIVDIKLDIAEIKDIINNDKLISIDTEAQEDIREPNSWWWS